MSQPPKKYKFHLNNVVYESAASSLTGAQIRAYEPGADPSFALFLEGHGNEADVPIADTTTVNLEKDHGPPKLFTVPPATFGGG